MTDKSNIISTRQKLGALIKRFLKLMDDQKNTIFEINNLLNEGTKIFKDPKKTLDIIFYFEGIGLILKISQEHMVYVGFRGMVRKLQQFENGQSNGIDHYYEEAMIMGKMTTLKPQMLAGQLLGSIFYGLVYQKEATTKSSIEDMVEAFMYHQKDANLKNFVPQILNILGIIGLIEKNEATQVINYIGPDLKCYDETGKKISWKMFEVTKRQEQALGKQSQMVMEVKSQIVKDTNLPLPVHLSFFPQLCYAILRSSNWQKAITNTVFFIGRFERRSNPLEKPKSYKVDLELTYKSVSRQHALIVYNFQAQRWEIRCLSRKNLIKVDEERFAWGDRNIWLKNKSTIWIGPQKMTFVEVAQPVSD